MLNDPALKKYLKHLTLGTEIAISLGAPILIGYWLDTVYESMPWFTLSGVLLAMVLLVVMLIRLIKNVNERD